MSLTHNPFDPAHTKLPPEERRDAWWQGSADPQARPYTEDVAYAYEGRLMEGHNSRKADEATWAKIAFHLAAGVPIIRIAEQYHLSRSTIWRALSRSHNLRRRVAEERALLRREADSRFVAMRELVVDTLHRAIADGNMRATIWAAERLGLGAELLQQAEKPPRPGHARVPPGWMPNAAKTAAMMAELDAPDAASAPLPVPESSSPATGPAVTLAMETGRGMDPERRIIDEPVPGFAPAEIVPLVMAEPPPPRDVPADPAPVPPPTPLPVAAADDPVPPFPQGVPLRWRNRSRRKVRAASPPVPEDGPSQRLRRGSYRLYPRRAVRLLAWILHNSLPVADGVDGKAGLSAARWAARSRWLSWGDRPLTAPCDAPRKTSHNVPLTLEEDVEQTRRRLGMSPLVRDRRR